MELCTRQTVLSGLSSLLSDFRSEGSHALPLVDDSYEIVKTCEHKQASGTSRPNIRQHSLMLTLSCFVTDLR